MFISDVGIENEEDLLEETMMKMKGQRLRDVYILDKLIILPDDKFKEKWELIIMALLLFTAIATPYRIAFFTTDSLGWTFIDYFTDFIFGVDIIINFFSAFEDSNDELILSRKIIACSYLKTWFTIDFISIIPV